MTAIIGYLIFGHLKVEQVRRLGSYPFESDNPEGFLHQHPHTIGEWNENNTLYFGPGAKSISAHPCLRLSKPDSLVVWNVPTWLKATALTYHSSETRWLKTSRCLAGTGIRVKHWHRIDTNGMASHCAGRHQGRQMRTLIYKRTHIGDPDPQTGVFGNCDCMGSVRRWQFDAVIGIGGIGQEPKTHGIAGKLTWIGIGPKKFYDHNCPDSRGPQLRFRHFWYRGENGPPLKERYPALANRMYGKNVRLLVDGVSFAERQEVERILRLARNAPRSALPQRIPRKTHRSTKC